jgi:hypothetical protein
MNKPEDMEDDYEDEIGFGWYLFRACCASAAFGAVGYLVADILVRIA